MDEFTPYEIALLCGGPARAAQCALAALYEQRQVRVSRGTRRVTVVEPDSDDPVQKALLEEVPDAGIPLSYVLGATAESADVGAVTDGLVGRGLLRKGFRGRLRRTRQGRTARRRLRTDAESGASSGLTALSNNGTSKTIAKLAALGTEAVEDAKLRRVLEMDDPKPMKLPYNWAKSAGRNSDGERSNLPDNHYGMAYYDGYDGYDGSNSY